MTTEATSHDVAPALEASIIGALRRFGEIGPVYEVIGEAEAGFVTIRLVESGDTARYPVEELSKDQAA